jgi:hypothetical protein
MEVAQLSCATSCEGRKKDAGDRVLFLENVTAFQQRFRGREPKHPPKLHR